MHKASLLHTKPYKICYRTIISAQSKLTTHKALQDILQDSNKCTKQAYYTQSITRYVTGQ